MPIGLSYTIVCTFLEKYIILNELREKTLGVVMQRRV
jgi:hypothetical protein